MFCYPLASTTASYHCQFSVYLVVQSQKASTFHVGIVPAIPSARNLMFPTSLRLFRGQSQLLCCPVDGYSFLRVSQNIVRPANDNLFILPFNQSHEVFACDCHCFNNCVIRKVYDQISNSLSYEQISKDRKKCAFVSASCSQVCILNKRGTCRFAFDRGSILSHFVMK